MVDKKTAWMKSIANGAVPKNKHLAILLSSLPTHDKMNLQLEQYTTPGDLASRWINEIYNLNNFEISEYDIVDLCCGNGILGFGLALMGARSVTLVDCDSNALESAKKSEKILKDKVDLDVKINYLQATIGKEKINISKNSILISNPPWGTQKPKADRPILEVIFKSNAKEIHILHASNVTHLIALGNEYGWDAQKLFKTNFILPAMYQHHKQKNAITEIICWKFTKSIEGEV
tara:strand:- start:1897 stop:2595 length:699 start_codon:yes stop_codon:yes gene_type:complete